jgi:hypothetical protein
MFLNFFDLLSGQKNLKKQFLSVSYLFKAFHSFTDKKRFKTRAKLLKTMLKRFTIILTKRPKIIDALVTGRSP